MKDIEEVEVFDGWGEEINGQINSIKGNYNYWCDPKTIDKEHAEEVIENVSLNPSKKAENEFGYLMSG